MKQQNYREKDDVEVSELRRTALKQLDNIEKDLWTDDIDTAIECTVAMHLTLVKLSQLKSVKRVEDKFNQLYQVLNANGINAQIIFRHKKTD